MKNIRFCGLLVTILLFVSSAAKAFDDYQTPIWKAQFAPESPSAAAMAQYSDELPTHYSGEVSLNIPVYTWQDGMFTIPISLAYHSSGYKPGQASGSVGLGWMLNVGGVITREVRGIPDEVMKSDAEFKWANQMSHYEEAIQTGDPIADHWLRYYSYRHNSMLAERTVDGYARVYSMAEGDISEQYDYVHTGTIGEEYRFCHCYTDSEYDVDDDRDFINNTNHGHYAETEPDIFHLSLPGISASFILQPDHGIKFLSCEGVAPGELDVVFDFIPSNGEGIGSKWIIKDGQNNKYTFDVLEVATTVCNEALYANDDTGTISAWRLSSIEHPSGRVARFSYATCPMTSTNRSAAIVIDHQQVGHDEHDKVWRKEGYEEACPIKRTIDNLTQEAKLTGIVIDGRGRIDFNWNVDDTMESIRIYNSENREIKSCRMEYIRPSYVESKIFLTRVSLSGIGKYAFDYHNLSTVPSGVRYTDNYNYANGRDLWNIVPNMLSRNDIEQMSRLIVDGRSFNDAATRYGMLSRVTYPTGGYSDYSYERNTYRHDILGNNWTAPQLTGGMRVSKINTYDTDGTIIRSTTFDYGDGILLDWPHIYYEYQYDDNDNELYVHREGISTLSSIGFNKSSHIEYPRVIQYVRDSDGGNVVAETEYEYATSSTLNIYSASGVTEKLESASTSNYLSVGSSWTIHFSGMAGVANDAQFYGNAPMSGKLLKKTERSLIEGVDPQIEILTTYSQFSPEAVVSVNCVKIGLGPLCLRRYASHLIHNSSESTTITNADGSTFSTSTVRVVNDGGQITSVSTTDSDSRTLTDNIMYHSRAKGFITCVESFRGARRVALSLYDYQCLDSMSGWFVPQRKTEYGITATGGRGNSRITQFQTFDAWGNPTSFTDYKGLVHSLTWDGSGMFPVEERVASSDGLQQTRSWTWIPMVGIDSATDFNGRTIRYGYDNAGRLTAVYNEDGCINSYSYSIVSDDNCAKNCIAGTTYTAPINGSTEYTYYDGLGRQVQQVNYDSISASSIITGSELDAFGRVIRSWLPYASTVASGTSYHASFAAECGNWYAARYPMPSTGTNLYAANRYENGMGGRLIAEVSPGAAFENHPQTHGYYSYGNYQSETVTNPDGVMSVVVKDREGRTVSESTGGNITTYTYDHKGNLTCVTQPEGTSFEYTYDERNRLVSKTIPGGGTTTYTYDAADNMITRQDSRMQSEGKHLLYSYDGLGRLIRTIYISDSSLSYSILQEYGYDMSDNGGVMPQIPSRLAFRSETGVVSSAASSANMLVYSKSAVPYDFELSDGGIDLSEHTGVGTQALVPGPTIEANQYLEKAYYYDAVGRIAQTVEDNILGGVSRTSYKYDLAGNVLETVERHTRRNVTGEDVKTTWRSYDGRGNMISESVTLNGVNAEVENTYNSLNQLICSHCGDPEYGFNINRNYNLPGWLTGITAQDYSGGEIFSESLAYESPSFGTPCYSGNISQISWQQHGGAPMSFALGYDNCGRFTGSRPQTGNAFSEQGITYDGNGNILSINRYGNTSSAPTSSLSYFYDGNRLESVTDNAVSYSYDYDVNGNMTVDGMQGLTIDYNLLNLPTTVSRSGMIATYRYSFDGVKREAKVTSGASSVPAGQPIAYAYLGSLVYAKTGGSYQLESTDFSGGRIVPGDTQHPVHYHITDHLGSVRVVAWPEEGDDAAVILEQNDYYPYGLRMDNGLTASTDNRYRFSGKEVQPLMGGSILDFGARYYNPTIARWTTIDPKAEKYYSTTPYSYCTGNPVMYVDPDGEDFRDFLVGLLVGFVTDLAPGTSNKRDEYSPDDKGDYNRGLKTADQVSTVIGVTATTAGSLGMTVGSATSDAGAILSLSGAGAEIGIPAVAAGEGISAASAVLVGTGGIVVYNASKNKAEGYDRGQDGNKGSKGTPSQAASQVKKGNGPNEIGRIDQDPSGKYHAHNKDKAKGALKEDGTPHDGGNGGFSRKTLEWLYKYGFNKPTEH